MSAGDAALAAIAGVLAGGRPLLLDGGLGSELAARGYDLSTPLWSAELILSHPAALRAVHRAFVDAGADCLISASYQASPAGLRAAGVDADTAAAVFRRAVEIAREACAEGPAGPSPRGALPLVAASVGPYGASLADGSEYRGGYALDAAGLAAFHGERLRLLDRAGADLLACETLPDRIEAEVLRDLLASVATPAWVSFCCRDAERLADGSSLAAAAALFRGHPRVFAVGVNCCAPAVVDGAIACLRGAVPDKMIVVYPNSGQSWDAAERRWRGEAGPADWPLLARGWYHAGARLIGGCCRTGPGTIAALARVDDWQAAHGGVAR